MFIQFDKNKMHVQIICGVLEKYEPSKEVQNIHERVEALRKKMSEFMLKEIAPELNAISKVIDEENKKSLPKEEQKKESPLEEKK